MERPKKSLFTILYPFMSGALNLAGLTKECFAVIFGFWYFQGQNPVGVSLTTMQTITGGTRPAVIQAVHKLEEAGLILASRTSGKKTFYEVKLPEQILTDYKEMYASKKLVNLFSPQEYTPFTSSSQSSLPQNNKNAKREPIIRPLKVKPASEIHSGSLKEA